MSYTPTTWADNDYITVEKLNKMEQGLKEQKSEVYICTLTATYNLSIDWYDYELDKTYAEVKAAMLAGKQVMIITNINNHKVISPIKYLEEETSYYCLRVDSNNAISLSAATDSELLSWTPSVDPLPAV